jgi:hypothetical protein
MGNPSFYTDTNPWDQVLTSGAVTFDAVGNATCTGSCNLLTKWFKVTGKTSFSLFAQATGTGVNPNGIIAQANLGYNDSRQVQEPGFLKNVTADFGLVAGAGTSPGVHRPAATFSGNVSDYIAGWACPYPFIRFGFVQSSGTAVIAAQFYMGEV